MELQIFTVFNKVDGNAENVIVSRSEARFVREFLNGINARNQELSSRKYPTLDINEYEIRKVGTFDDMTCVITPCPPQVVPFSVSSLDEKK